MTDGHGEGDDLQQWQPPRGPLTKLIAWAILLVMGLSVVGAVVLLWTR